LGYLLEVLLFAAPFALYAVWRRNRPEPPSRVLGVAVLALALGVLGATWYGFSRSSERGSVYVPARMAPDGSVLPAQVGPRR
jgi:hypothetical protein